MKPRLLCVIALVFGLIGIAGASPALAQHDMGPAKPPAPIRPGDPKRLAESEAAQLAASIDRAEADYFSSHHAYTSFERLERSHLLDGKRALPFPVSSAGVVKDHTVRLLVSPDGRQYMLSIAPDPGGCGFGVFSDESGAVYVAPSLDCSE